MAFLRNLIDAAYYKIHTIPTGNGTSSFQGSADLFGERYEAVVARNTTTETYEQDWQESECHATKQFAPTVN